MRNADIRELAYKNNVRLWQVAERLSLNDGNFSRKLRKELPEAEKETIRLIILELAKEAEYAETTREER